MMPNDKPALCARVALAMELHHAPPPSPLVLDHWFTVLGRFALARVEAAFAWWDTYGKAPPRPADIVERIEAELTRERDEEDARRRAEEFAGPGAMVRTEAGRRAAAMLRDLARAVSRSRPNTAWAAEVLARYEAGHRALTDEAEPFRGKWLTSAAIRLACEVARRPAAEVDARHRAARLARLGRTAPATPPPQAVAEVDPATGEVLTEPPF